MEAYRPLVASRFADASLGVQPHWARPALAQLVDMTLVAGLVAALCGAGDSLPSGNPVPFGITVAVLALVVPWPVGFLCHRGHTPGTLLRGVWRSGWLMFARTVLALTIPASLLLDVCSGGPPSGIVGLSRDFHVSVDKRRTAGLLDGSGSP